MIAMCLITRSEREILIHPSRLRRVRVTATTNSAAGV
jgi:hypothetical protein